MGYHLAVLINVNVFGMSMRHSIKKIIIQKKKKKIREILKHQPITLYHIAEVCTCVCYFFIFKREPVWNLAFTGYYLDTGSY